MPAADVTSSRTTVLFTKAAVFPDSFTFLSVCKDKLREAYGVSAVGKPGRQYADKRFALCARTKCDFKVVARLRSAKWRIDLEECCWEHNHDSRLSVAGKEADDPSTADESAPHREKQASSAIIEQLPTPGMPQEGDSFVSPEEALAAAAKALLPVYGYAMALRPMTDIAQTCRLYCTWRVGALGNRLPDHCRFRFSLAKCNEGWVVQPSEHAKHNHPPRPALPSRSSLQSRLKNPVVRAAIGLPPLTLSKGEKRPLEDPSTPASSSATPSPSRKRLQISPTSSAAGRPSSPVNPSPSSFVNADPLDLLLATPAPLMLFPPPPPPPSALYQPDLSFLPTLTSFLAAISPSLPPLATNLAHAGIDTLHALLAFVALEAAQREGLLNEMVETVTPAVAGVDGAGTPTRLQVKVLAKALRTAAAEL